MPTAVSPTPETTQLTSMPGRPGVRITALLRAQPGHLKKKKKINTNVQEFLSFFFFFLFFLPCERNSLFLSFFLSFSAFFFLLFLWRELTKCNSTDALHVDCSTLCDVKRQSKTLECTQETNQPEVYLVATVSKLTPTIINS